MRNIIWFIFALLLSFFPAISLANSLEYLFDDTFFSWSYSPEWYQSADVHFLFWWNNFWWKIFFQDIKAVELTQLEITDWSQRYCNKQVRWFYINSARWNRVWPLDQDSLGYLQSIDSWYNDIVMTWWFFVCSNPSNGVVGYIEHRWKWQSYHLIAWLELNSVANTYLPFYEWDGNFLFSEWIVTWYVFDSYWWIAQLLWSWLDIQYICGDALVEDTEICDDWLTNGQTIGWCNATCNWYVATICWNSQIEWEEACDDWWNNGQAGYCNLACNWTISVPSGWGGWWWLTLVRDVCPEHRDCSNSYYDLVCGPCSFTWHSSPDISSPLLWSIVNSPFPPELNDAYLWAFDAGITTMSTIQRANMTGTLLRSHLAKMISVYAITIHKKQVATWVVCEFSDMTDQSQEMQFYAKIACQLWLMGLDSSGVPNILFNPQWTVTRAQFGTVMSRLLFGNTYNAAANESVQWYEKHLNALKSHKIMNTISAPMMLELRWWVMLMMMRSSL